MNFPLANAIRRAETWPQEAQEELASYAAEIQAGLMAAAYVPRADELAGIDRGIADANAGRFATLEMIAEVFARHRPK